MIFIENIIFSIQKVGGISAVWYEFILRMLLDNEINTRFIEYKDASHNILRRNLRIPSAQLINGKSTFLKYKRFFNIRLKYDQPFIFHSSDYRISKNTNAINFVTIHDFIYFMNKPKGIGKRFNKLLHCMQLTNAVKGADYIICVSNNTKLDLLKFVPNIKESRIHVIYNGVSNDYFPLGSIADSLLPFEPKTYVLYVGSRSKYKNFKLVVDSVAKTELALVVVGNKLNTEEFDYIKKHFNVDKFSFFMHVDNEILNKLYNGAFCLLYPSSYEGFGIPIIEAQKSGCPVIAYNASSIPEVIGDTPLLIKELSIENILCCFNILKNDVIREQIIQNGINNAKKFTWDKAYLQLKTLYVEAGHLNRKKASYI